MPLQTQGFRRRPGSRGYNGRSNRRPGGPIGRLPPNTIVLAQLGNGVVPTATQATCSGSEPTAVRGPTSIRLQLQHVSDSVFGRRDPRPDDVVQGAIATCPAAAAMVALAHTDPAAIRSMIIGQPASSGSPQVYHVQFLRTNARRVCVTTQFYHQAGHFQYASSNNHVIWPSLLEKAYAIYAGGNSYGGLASSQRQLGSPPDVNQVMQDFVGNYNWSAATDAQNVTLPLTNLIDTKRNELIQALRQSSNRPTIAGSLGSNVPAGTNVVANHAYAVMRYRNGQVTLRNPWNNTQIAGGAQFRLSLSEFQSAFQMVLWRV